MMSSNKNYKEAYVWIWLPEQIEPVVAGKLEFDNGNIFSTTVRVTLSE